MKRTLPIALLLTSAIAASAQTLINENFDSYGVGSPIASVSPLNWNTWSGSPGGADDAPVSNAYAHSGANCVEFIAVDAAGGPGDVLLLLGDRTVGYYTLTWWMYIPSGKGGYFNIQHSEDVTPASFAAEIIFLDGGTVECTANGATDAGSYPQDTWFQVNLVFDLANVNAVFAIDFTPVSSWAFDTETDGTPGANQIGAIDFYSYGGGAPAVGEYYIDDVAFLQIPVGIDENDGYDLLTFPNPAGDQLFVDVPNTGTAPLVMLSDAAGKVVAEGRTFSSVGDVLRMELDLRALPVGVYTLRVNDGTRAITRKVVKS